MNGMPKTNPRDTLNLDVVQQLNMNPTGVIEAYEGSGLRWDRIFDQIREWAEAVSVKNKVGCAGGLGMYSGY